MVSLCAPSAVTSLLGSKSSLDLTPFVGEPIRIGFQFVSDASETAAGWIIDDVAVFSTDFVSPVTLENPRSASFQSGVGVISGWACHAHEIVIELNGMPLPSGLPHDGRIPGVVCGDTDNGFSLLWNWNNLGAGTHTVRALIDGVEFANTTVRVTTFGRGSCGGRAVPLTCPTFPPPARPPSSSGKSRSRTLSSPMGGLAPVGGTTGWRA